MTQQHEKGAKPPIDRKAEQRKRDKATGVKRVDLRLPPELSAKLDELMVVRGGSLGPYEIQEYLATLIELDYQKLELQREQLAKVPCKSCGKPLPEGCGAAFKGQTDCLQTREEKQLLLRELPRIAFTPA
ncbi:hypothetical protein AhyVDH1_007 [Aeromonas phage AhyVDH1]|nr:hypothetical protein AhyVDH1_007 [Aeromonas phage AhyVDH1]